MIPSRKRKSPRKRENNVSKPKFAKLSAAKALLSLYECAASTSDNSIENNVIDKDHSATCAGNYSLENNTFVEEPILSTSTSDKLLENNVIVEDHSATCTCNNLLENNASVEEPISSTCVSSCPEEQYRADEQNNRGKEKVSESNENNQSPRKWTMEEKKRFRRESFLNEILPSNEACFRYTGVPTVDLLKAIFNWIWPTAKHIKLWDGKLKLTPGRKLGRRR